MPLCMCVCLHVVNPHLDYNTLCLNVVVHFCSFVLSEILRVQDMEISKAVKWVPIPCYLSVFMHSPFHVFPLPPSLPVPSFSSYRLPPVVMSPVVYMQQSEDAPILYQRERKEEKQRLSF